MRRFSIASIALSFVALSLAGCGGGKSKPAIGLSITPSTAATIVQGQQKNLTATVSNDSTSQGVTWSLSGSGCTGSACGTLSNATATSVTYNTPTSVSSNLSVTITATSVADKTKSASVALTVVPLPSITTASLPKGTQNVAYTATTLAAAGGVTPYKWSVSNGTLPAGISLNSNTGVISGTPTAAGTSSFTVQVADSSSPALTATKALSIVVDPPPPLSVTTSSLPSGTQSTAYTVTLAATGGTTPYTAWTVTAGALPAGLTLQSGTGIIDGTPTAAGTSDFTVQVTDSTTPALTATKALSILIAPPPLAVTTTSLPAGTVNSTYPPTTLQSTGGTAPVSWSVTAGSLPAGLTLHGATGVIDGTPTASGTANFTVTASDSSQTPQTKSKDLSIVINPALAITTTSLADGAVNTAYSATLASTGGTAPVTWSISQGTLPAGLSLNSTTGVISGTPTAAGTSNFSVKATDHSTPPQTQETALSITVAAVPLAITTTSLSNATIATAYTVTLAATGGTPPISWSVTAGSLPSWASLDSTTGIISGTPSGSPTTTNFTVTATDSGSPAQIKTQSLSITTVGGGVNNAELNGHYAFTARGYDSVGGSLVTMAGSLAANGNGSITGGVMDINTTTAIHTDLAITGGFYSVGDDQRGTLTLTTSQGDFNFAVVVGSISSGVASLGRLIGADSKMVAGTLKQQDASAFSTASVTGNYAFGIGGMEGAGRFAAAGVVTLSGSGTYSISADTNDAGRMNQDTGAPASMSGTYTIGDSANGRGAMMDTTNGSHMAVYVVSASEIFLINTDAFNVDGPPIFTGSAQKQSGTFNNASMNGSSVFVSQSVSSYAGGVPSAAYVGAGVFTFNGTGGVAAEMDENDGGSVTHSTGMSATYTVASNGRMIVSVGGSPIPEVFYLVGPGKAFSVGTDGAVAEGSLKRQDSGPFSNASITGNYVYGVEPPVMNTSNTDLGAVAANGAGSLTGTSTRNSAGMVGSESFTDTYSVSANGRGVFSDSIMYIISTSKAVMISVEPSSTNPTIHTVDK